MPSTYLCLHYHLVFSTKNREASINSMWRSRLHQYLGGTVNNLGAQSKSIGGTADHVHLLVELRATHALADFMRDVKRGTSIWIHDEISQKNFVWQEGYAGFTVSPSAVDEVRRYIENQDEHDRVRTFREELILMLQRAGVKYDERYLD